MKSREETRKIIKDYLTICLMVLYMVTSIIGLFCPRVRESKDDIKDAIELIEGVK